MSDKCLLNGWSSSVFILLVNIFNMFNLFINNIIRKPIIDESLFYDLYLFIKYWRKRLVWHGISGY